MDRSIGSFWPYAPTLWSFINRAKPVDEPGSLTSEQVYAVTAYLLHMNGIIGEHDVMDTRTLPQVRTPWSSSRTSSSAAGRHGSSRWK